MKRFVLDSKRQVRGVTMKKIIALLTVLTSVFFSAEAVAQDQPLACQSDKSGGLFLENGSWVVSRFKEKKFILIQSKNFLSKASVAKALGNVTPDQVVCSPVYGRKVSCSDEFGGYLVFDPTTLKGGISIIWGATFADDTDRDSLSVTAFSCTPF